MKDANFLTAVKRDGIPDDGTLDLRRLGNEVCSKLEQGRPSADIATWVGETVRPPATVNDTATAYFTEEQAKKFVNESIGSYCPQFKGQMLVVQ